ncbi:MAG TPA: hypothetical protein PKA13_16935 [Geminicoccaceae bacterium]|nr:hypothetical protein [Geminicoccus sp.]HMU51463.1 hypothetical protein [Geminicoccaceae bacterium]
MRRAGQRCAEVVVPLRQRDTARRLRDLSPTASVPCLVLDGVPITGPMGIADHAAWRLPSLWPDPEQRELARRSALAAAHGLGELAAFLPMDMAARFGEPGHLVRPVAEGLERLIGIWDECRAAATAKGPFLFGRFGVVDAMMAPWASRLLTHGIRLDRRHAAYVEALRALPEWREWESGLRAEPIRPEAVAAAVEIAPDEPAAAVRSPDPPSVPLAAATGLAEPPPAAWATAPESGAPVETAVEVPAARQPEPVVLLEPAEPAPAPPPAAAAKPIPVLGQLRPIRRPGHLAAPPAVPAPAAPPRRRPIRPPSTAAEPRGVPVPRARAVVALAAVAVIGTVAVLGLPRALATIELAIPYLRNAVQPAGDAPREPMHRADALPAALVAPEPTEAETVLHPRVVVHYSGTEVEAAQRLARHLAEKGYEVAIRPVKVQIARPSVRYYFADDRAATVELAASVEQSLDGRTNPRVLDLSHHRSKPRPGTLEVWIGPARS